MNRRTFAKLVAMGAMSLGIPKSNARAKPREIAITMDDFNWQNAVYQSASDRNKSILNVLDAHSIKGVCSWLVVTWNEMKANDC